MRVHLFDLDARALPASNPQAESLRDLLSRIDRTSTWGDARQLAATTLVAVPLDAQLYVDEAWQMLDSAERQRADSMRSPRQRSTYILAHAALRGLLALQLPGWPPALPFESGPFGKPRLPEGYPLHFSLSRREGISALAFGERPLGIDIERAREGIDIDGIAARFFTRAERDFLHEDGPAEARSRFFRLWTRKEAAVKAAGTGIDFLGAAEALTSRVRLPNESGAPRRYGLYDLTAATGDPMALATELPTSEQDDDSPPH